ncbi:MAG: tyrosine-type recombinase/integrase, partial [Pseudomonadota bacterium]|nr:tyrosine-type recombinase/integrase [Pseudomonadota bacterium]
EFLPTPEPEPVLNKSRRHGKIHSIDVAFRTARNKIGRPDVRFHDLRHTIATWLTEGGMPLGVVAKHLGHKDVAVTQRYAHADTQMVGAFLNDIITIEIPAKPEQNANNKVPQRCPGTEGSLSVRSTRGVTR